MVIVSDFYFDMAGNGVVEGISDHLTADPIDFVLERWRKTSWFTLYNHAKTGALLVRGMSACQFLAGSSQQLRKVVLRRWLRAQVTDGIAALSDSLLGREDCFIQGLHRGFRPSGQQIASRLKLKHEAVKTLQQCVV